jgi:hypothetical protein
MLDSHKRFDPYSPSTQSRQAVGRNMRHQMNTSVTAQSMGRNSVRGGSLRALGATLGGTTAAFAGLSNRLVNPSSNPINQQVGHVSTIRQMVNKGVGIGRGAATMGGVLVGTVAMAGISFMNGAMNQANDIMMERYMRDARYSNRLLTATSLGQASGNSPLSLGNHVGLSLALSKTRHGY